MLHIIPNELILEILQRLNWAEVLKAQLVCKRFQNLIQSSPSLRYKLLLGTVYHYNPEDYLRGDLPISTRSAQLSRIQDTWLHLSFQQSFSAETQQRSFLYETRDGILLQGKFPFVNPAFHGPPESLSLVWSKCPSLADPSAREWEWTEDTLPAPPRDVALDPAQDLVVLLSKHMSPQAAAASATVHLDFRRLSNGEVHPRAAHSIKFTVAFLAEVFQITISSDHLFILSGDVQLQAWNWTTGTQFLYLTGDILEGFALLDHDRLLLSRFASEYREWLLYQIDPNLTNGYERVASFWPPEFSEQDPDRTYNIRIYPPPASNDTVTLQNSSTRNQFQIDPKGRIVVFTFTSIVLQATITLVVPVYVFLRPIPDDAALDRVDHLPVIPFDDIMLETRFITNLPHAGWVRNVYGTRMGFIQKAEKNKATLLVYDFNPFTISKFLGIPRHETLRPDIGPMELRSTLFEKNGAFTRSIVGGSLVGFGRSGYLLPAALPFIETTVTLEDMDISPADSMQVIIDDERIMVVKGGFVAGLDGHAPYWLYVYTPPPLT